MTRINPAPALVLVLAAVTLGACGSSKPSRTSTGTAASQSRLDAAFIARVDELCRRVSVELNSHGRFPYPKFNPESPNVALLPKIGAYFELSRAAGDRVPAELAALGQPASGQTSWAAIVAVAHRFSALVDRQVAAANAANAAAFARTVSELQSLNEDIKRLFVTAGFPASSPCAEVL